MGPPTGGVAPPTRGVAPPNPGLGSRQPEAWLPQPRAWLSPSPGRGSPLRGVAPPSTGRGSPGPAGGALAFPPADWTWLLTHPIPASRWGCGKQGESYAPFLLTFLILILQRKTGIRVFLIH